MSRELSRPCSTGVKQPIDQERRAETVSYTHLKKAWQKQSYLSLGGVGEKALLRFLSDRPNIKTVYLCLDSDQAGNDACSRLAELVPEGLTVHRLIPLFKDWNDCLLYTSSAKLTIQVLQAAARKFLETQNKGKTKLCLLYTSNGGAAHKNTEAPRRFETSGFLVSQT